MWWLIVWMKGQIVNNLQQNAKPEDCNNDNNDWYKIQSSSCWSVEVPDTDHCHVLTIHKRIVDHISEACMSFDQVEEIKNTNECSDSIKAEFLHLCGAECRTLDKNPHKHNNPVNATQHKETILCARCKQSKCQYPWSYNKYAPHEQKY